jgi:hypothetical protein
MKRLRLLFLAIGLAGLLSGLFLERHAIFRLDGAEPAKVGGAGFVAGAAVDDFMLKDDALYAVNSLSPNAASAKDCKT